MRKAISRRSFFASILGLGALSATACSAYSEGPTLEKNADVAPVDVRVGSLKGPTSIGLAYVIDSAQKGETKHHYDFSLSGTADDLLPSILAGDLDIALIPANVASILYNKSKGEVQVFNINTLGVLSLLSTDANIKGLVDCEGKTIYSTGKGASPEFVLEYLLDKLQLKDKVSLEFVAEPTELLSKIAKAGEGLCVLPEPYATAAQSKVEGLKKVEKLGDLWDKLADKGSRQVTGVTVVRKDFAEKNAAVLQEFIQLHEASVNSVNKHPKEAAERLVEAGIFDNATLIEKAIPDCSLVCIRSAELKEALSGYLEVLFKAKAESVGGSLPKDDFYLNL